MKRMSGPSRLCIGGSLEAAATKRAFNAQLFAEVAPRYDFITRALSFGRDAAWKRDLVAVLPQAAAPVCLDLACGTGDLTQALAKRYPRGIVIGLDLTAGMLDLAVRRPAPGSVGFVQQDMGCLGIASGSVDIVTGGYALRNAPDLDVALAEVARVLRPGATAAFLDFSKPRSRFGQAIEHGLLTFWMSLWGWLLHRNPEVYGYIAQSLRHFPDRARLRQCLARHGLAVTASRRYFGGIMERVVVRRGEAPAEGGTCIGPTSS